MRYIDNHIFHCAAEQVIWYFLYASFENLQLIWQFIFIFLFFFIFRVGMNANKKGWNYRKKKQSYSLKMLQQELMRWDTIRPSLEQHLQA